MMLEKMRLGSPETRSGLKLRASRYQQFGGGNRNDRSKVIEYVNPGIILLSVEAEENPCSF